MRSWSWGHVHVADCTLQQAPGLNRSYGEIARLLAEDPRFFRATAPRPGGLPELSVYIHRSSLEGGEVTSRQSARKRR